MFTKGPIRNSLRHLARLYKGASSSNEATFYSKLAVLELCGWIEESMDDVVHRCARRCLREPTNVSEVSTEIVAKNFGFTYEKHFRRMLISVVGRRGIEVPERRMNQALLHRLKSTLGNLKTVRDDHAHTHLDGATATLHAPSWSIARCDDVYDGLREFDRALRACKL